MKKLSKVTAVTLVFAIILSFAAFAQNSVSAPEAYTNNSESIFSDNGKITLTPGTDSSCVNFSWLSHMPESFAYSRNADMTDAVKADVISVRTPLIAYVSNRAALTDLEAGVYYYEFTFDGKSQGVNSFEIKNPSDEFEVAFVSDPQIGRSGDNSEAAMLDDAYGWERTLNSIYSNTNASFVLSAGDQVNVAVSKKQYNALLNAPQMKALPVAATVGNHEMYSQFYAYHFFNPNVNENEALTFGGSDYYFSYGNALFIVLNTNNFLKADHEAALHNAVSAYPDAKYRIVMMHQSAYSIEPDAFDNKANYILMPALFEEYGIDLVLSGHDHIHARTDAINGVTYFEAGNASGGKYGGVDENKIPDYISNYVLMKEASYSVLSFSDSEITVKTYGTDSSEIYDEFTVSANPDTKTVPDYEPDVLYAPFVAFMSRLRAFINTFFHIFR